MESVQDRLSRLREERAAREKARIDKLRELNFKKYNNNEIQRNSSVKNIGQSNSSTNRLTSAPIKKTNVSTTKKIISNDKAININRDNKLVKDMTKTNGDSKPSNAQISTNVSKKIHTKPNKFNAITSKSNLKTNTVSLHLNSNNINKQGVTNGNAFKVHQKSNPSEVNTLKSQNSRKSIAVLSKPSKSIKEDSRKSIQLKPQNETKSRESVFDRLYKPKVMPKQSIDNATKLKMDPNYLRQVIRDSNLIINKRHTVFETKEKASLPVRRSISAVHLKRISKSELGNCIHKWASIGEKINKVHLNEINEDECVKDEKVVSAVKSERKRVKFQTPITSNFNTPKPTELQERLQKWLQKRGKSLNSYHHLQCFGLHHLPHDIRSVPHKLSLDNVEENKENVALEHDSDNDSFTENVNDKAEEQNIEVKNIALDKWRRASYVSDSVGFNESCDTITSTDGFHQDELLIGALNDLSELLREGFDWEQCARWLRVIRERFPEAPEGAAYWECRAALEERRGDLPASVQCWERAIANGTEQSVVEANLDQLLDKFMQLKISPSSGRQRVADPKLLDVKNVFKSTIIRFAVQQAKLRQSNGTPRYTVTPVRRSSRLSCIPRATPLAASPLAAPPPPTTPINTPRAKHTPRSTRTPLSLCKSFHQAAELFPVEFKPNKALIQTP